MSDLFAVTLDHGRPIDAAQVATIVRAHFPVTALPDLRRQCRYCGGILAEDRTFEEAEALVATLKAAGYVALALPAVELPPLPAPKRIISISLVDSGIDVQLTHTGAFRRLETGAVRMVLLFGREIDLADKATGDSQWASVQRASESTPLSDDGGRLADSLARLRKRDRRDLELLMDLRVGDEVFRIERLGTHWPESPYGHSLETYLGLGRAICAATGFLEAPSENAGILRGLVNAGVFVHDQELKQYERWLLSPLGRKSLGGAHLESAHSGNAAE